MTNENKLVVAETILAQLGGSKFLAMTGAKNLLGDERSLTMKLGRGAMGGITHLTITLEADDTYTMKFLKVRGVKVSTVHESAGVHAGELRRAFEGFTGFATSL